MGTILTLAVSAYFFIISYRLQFAYFLFIFLIPFLPKYIGIGVGSESFALSLKRILLMILFMSAALSFTQNGEYISKRISQVYQQNKILINILLLFFVLKVVSLSLNSRELSSYIMIFNDFLFSFFIFMLTILLIDSEEAIYHLIKIIFYGYTIVLILVLIESIFQSPLYSMLASSQMVFDMDYSKAYFRGGGYRTHGSFTNSIILGEYLVMLFPIIVAYINRNKYALIFKIVYLALFIYAINSTGSRATILMSAALVYVYLLLKLYSGNQFTRFVANLFNLIVVSFISYFVFNYVSDLLMNYTGRFDKIVDIEDRSSTSRALQYIRVYDKMHEAPFFGFGRIRNFIELLRSPIDSYYFWTILEVGIIGISIYFLFLYTLVKTALNQYKLPYKSYYLLPLVIAIFISIFYQVFLATPDNHIYLYIFAGLISVMKVMQNDKKAQFENYNNVKLFLSGNKKYRLKNNQNRQN